jgi:hypothetical protein
MSATGHAYLISPVFAQRECGVARTKAARPQVRQRVPGTADIKTSCHVCSRCCTMSISHGTQQSLGQYQKTKLKNALAHVRL